MKHRLHKELQDLQFPTKHRLHKAARSLILHEAQLLHRAARSPNPREAQVIQSCKFSNSPWHTGYTELQDIQIPTKHRLHRAARSQIPTKHRLHRAARSPNPHEAQVTHSCKISNSAIRTGYTKTWNVSNFPWNTGYKKSSNISILMCKMFGCEARWVGGIGVPVVQSVHGNAFFAAPCILTIKWQYAFVFFGLGFCMNDGYESMSK